MGNCISFAPEGIPKCDQCGKTGEKEWHTMNSQEKALWRWDKAGACICKGCFFKEKVEKIRYEKDREYYKKAGDQLYPRPEHQRTLKRIHSSEAWEGTSSFYSSWRLPSALAHLVPRMGERKSTGMVNTTSGASAAAGDGEEEQQQGMTRGGSGGRALEQLDEELEIVEEESLHSDSDSVHSGSVHSSAGGGGSAAALLSVAAT